MITINENMSYNIKELFDNFMNEKKGRVSETTFEYYKEYNRIFLTFLEGKKIKNSDQLNIQVINYYIVWLNKNHNINTTSANIHLRAIRVFIYWMQKKEEIKIKQFKVQELPENKRKEKEVYSEEELKRLLKKPNLQKVKFATYRNWVIINFFLATGSRRHTTINVKIEDIDLKQKKIKLFNFKRHQTYIMNFYNSFNNIIKEYLKIRKGKDKDYLFPTQYGTQLSLSGLTTAISRYNRRRGVERTSLHAFRHTFASLWIKNGGDPYILSDLLDHSDMETSRIYVHQFQNDRRIEHFNPLESLRNKNKKNYINM